jgi:multidrug resistance efflux pump
MKTTLSTCALALAALLAGTAMAGSQPQGDGPRGLMKADTNGDGKISKEEAATLHDQAQGEWFDKTDLDKDGFVTQDELRQARETRGDRKGEMKARMEERFKEADANSDGQISLDEAQAKMPKLAERFNTLDTDKNGLLSKDELKHGRAGRAKPQG